MKKHKWPRPTVEVPTFETVEEWMIEDGGCDATDGCWVEVDGICPHGFPSWLMYVGDDISVFIGGEDED